MKKKPKKQQLHKKKPSKEQIKIARHIEGHLTVHAGAGCGKTFVLTEAVSSAIKRGTPPSKILVLTFNKKTEVDFKRLLKEILEKDAESVNVFTFHGFGAQLINNNHKLFGFSSIPSITTDDYPADKLVANIVNKHNIKKSELNVAFKAHLNCTDESIFSIPVKQALTELLKRHITNKRQHNMIDFNDMQSLPLKVLKPNSTLLQEMADSYQLLLVDELQDINKKQATLIALLAARIGTSITAGDNKQSIYGFRGARPELALELEQALQSKCYHLTESYRCPVEAMGFINAIAATITGEQHVDLDSKVSGYQPVLKVCKSVDVQADYIANKITKLVSKGVPYSDVALIGRTNKELNLLQLALTSRSIPCTEKYISDEDIESAYKLIRSLLRIACWVHITNNNEEYSVPDSAIKHVLKAAGIKTNARQKIVENVSNDGWTAFKVNSKNSNYSRVNNIKNAIYKASKCNSPSEAVQRLIDGVKPIINMANKNHKDDLWRKLSGIKLMVRNKTWKNINFKSLQPPSAENDNVELTTIHSAKGKEWPYVFVTHVVDGSIPSYHFSKKIDEGFKEELRVFYVAITRHSKKLWLLQTPISTSYFNHKGKRKNTNFKDESRFIEDCKHHLKVYS